MSLQLMDHLGRAALHPPPHPVPQVAPPSFQITAVVQTPNLDMITSSKEHAVPVVSVFNEPYHHPQD